MIWMVFIIFSFIIFTSIVNNSFWIYKKKDVHLLKKGVSFFLKIHKNNNNHLIINEINFEQLFKFLKTRYPTPYRFLITAIIRAKTLV